MIDIVLILLHFTQRTSSTCTEQEICYLQLKVTKGPGELSRKLLISPEEKKKQQQQTISGQLTFFNFMSSCIVNISQRVSHKMFLTHMGV